MSILSQKLDFTINRYTLDELPFIEYPYRSTYLYVEVAEGITENIIKQKEKRHSWEPPYSYIGIADADSLEAYEFWTISRMEIDEDGSSDKKIALGAWTNRTNLTYS